MKNMKNLTHSISAIIKTLCVLSVVSTYTAQAEYANVNEQTIGYAKVIYAKPVYGVYETSVPQERCWVQTVREDRQTSRNNNAAPVILGGVIGGAVGHAVGHNKRNKQVGAVIGTVLGAAIGSDIAQNKKPRATSHVKYRDVERCEITETIETEERLIGYDVAYAYQGEQYLTRMSKNPGKNVKVAVSVEVIQD